MIENLKFQHPPAVKILFLTEMWERYGFYAIQTLLALYMAHYFNWDDSNVYALVSSFTALTYLSPIMGGWVADHLLGQKTAVIYGIIFLFFSYFSFLYVRSSYELIFALAGIAIGTGLVKPNISSLVGIIYPNNSLKRETGYTIFYMGITLGIILGTLLPSHLHRYYGWSIALSSACVGIIFAFIVFTWGIYHYKIQNYKSVNFNFFNLFKATILLVILYITSLCLLFNPLFANITFLAMLLITILYVIFCIFTENSRQAQQTIIIGILCIISVMFWSFYFQMFLSLTLFLYRVVKPELFGFHFPVPYYISIQSIGMLVFGTIIAKKKKHINLLQQNLQVGKKFFIAMVFMLLAYSLIVAICFFQRSTLFSPLYFIPSFLLISVAELYISPIGLAAISSLASRKKVSTMIGIFFVSLGFGGFISGKLAYITAIPAGQLSLSELILHYAHVFQFLSVILLCCTILSYFLNYLIKIIIIRNI